MVNGCALESLNRTFEDIMKVNLPFGRKVLILGERFLSSTSSCSKGYKGRNNRCMHSQVPIMERHQSVTFEAEYEFCQR